MSNLQVRQEKIQAKRKQTSLRDFLCNIASFRPLTFCKNQNMISRYPDSERIGKLSSIKDFERDQMVTNDLYSNNFFYSFQQLWLQQSIPSVYHVAGCENCEYSDMIHSGKNIYLSAISTYGCENILYTFATREHTKNVINSLSVSDQSENIYQSVGILSSYNIFYSKYITNCNNVWFCTDCIGCTECLLSYDLTNKSYMIRNVQYSKEEYYHQKDVLLKANKNQFDDLFEKLPKQGSCASSINTTGSFVTNSTNVENGYYGYNANNCRNVFFIGGNGGDENMYDMFVGGAIMGNHLYGCQGAGNSEHIYCSAIINDSSFLYYCIGCIGCNFCFGCTRLQNKSYCILNKQYAKEERYAKVDEIFTQMEKDGQLGEFFPASMNPFYFNDTAAYLIDPSFTKEEVTKLGYLRRDEPIKVDIPEGAITVKSSELAQFESIDEQGNWKLDETVCKRVILDEHGDAYRIIPMELEFLQKHGLPLPRKHWLTRMKENFRIS